MKGPKRSFDTLLFFALLCVLGIGLLMIASAGVFYGEARFGDEYYFLKQQLIGLGAGMLFLLFFQSSHQNHESVILLYMVWLIHILALHFYHISYYSHQK